MIANKEKILGVFPEMSASFEKVEKELALPGCSGCRRGRIIRELEKEYQAIKSKYPDRDSSSIPVLSSVVKTIREGASHRAPFQHLPVRRKPCPDCVLKHLSNCFVLNGEVVNGYDEFTERSADELESAYSTGTEEQRHALMLAIHEHWRFRISGALDHLAIVQAMLSQELTKLGPESWWRMIGHLNQAEEECWGANVKFAERIREERLAVMANKLYKPDILKLLKETE